MGRDEASGLISLYEELWRLEDAATAAAAASERLREASERLAAAQALADDAAIKIADLQDPAGALGRAREREIAAAVNGQTRETAEELRRLYESLWQLEDAATAAAKAAEAMAAAQKLMDDANVRIADLQDPEGAKDRARQREIAEAVKGQTRESAEALRKLYAELWELEDAAAAAAKAAEVLARAQEIKTDLTGRIADLQDPAGAHQRAREREIAEAIKGQTPETAEELRRLYETLYGLEDAATAAAAAAEALARAQEITTDLTGRIADLQDPAGAQQRARERESAEAIKGQTPETAAELRRL
jgi:hypothetical protein